MGSSRSHPLPPGIFVEMPHTKEELIEEIKRLRQRVKELESKKAARVDYEEVVLDPPDDDDDDIMNDPDVREMVENGEHTCHMFDAHCQACEEDEDEEEVQVTQSDAIQRVDQLRAHFC
jgi:hypothetical protein